MITKCPVQIFPAIFPHRHNFTHRNWKRLSVPQSGLYKFGRNRLHCSLIIIVHISHIMTCYERKWTREKASKDREHETTSESLSHTDECNAIPLRVFERVWFGRYDTISAKVKSKANVVGTVLRVKPSSLSHSLSHILNSDHTYSTIFSANRVPY